MIGERQYKKVKKIVEVEVPPRLNRYARYMKKVKGSYVVRYPEGSQFEGAHQFDSIKHANEFIEKYAKMATPIAVNQGETK